MEAFVAAPVGAVSLVDQSNPRSKLRKAVLTLGVAAAAIAGVQPAMAQTTNQPQQGPNPVLLDPIIAKPIDNKIVLTAGSAAMSGNPTTRNDTGWKYWGVLNFQATTDSFKWTVNVGQDTAFHVESIINAAANETFQLAVDGTANAITFSSQRDRAWDNAVAAQPLTIPAGTHTITLTKLNSTANDSIKSIELIRNSDMPAYQNRITAFHGRADWMANKVGVWYDHGAWTVTKNGQTQSLETVANNFNVQRFVATLQRARADYVVFSATWVNWYLLQPNAAADAVMAGTGVKLTSTRDVYSELAAALHKVGIKFILYYHNGHSTGSGWWTQQHYPTTFPVYGVGDRSTFLNNEKAVLTEIGNRMGPLLDGWFIDDGLVWYPAGMEEIGAYLRTGNPNRMISMSGFDNSNTNKFEDLYWGEQCQSGQIYFPLDSNGIITSGPYAGERYHCDFLVEAPGGDWGSYPGNLGQNIPPATVEYSQSILKKRAPGTAQSLFYWSWLDNQFIDGSAGALGQAQSNGGAGYAVSVGKDGDVWALRYNGTTAHNVSGTWVTVPGALERLSVGNASNVWGVDGYGKPVKWDGTTWADQTGNLGSTAKEVSVGTDGTVWALRTDSSIYKLVNGSWSNVYGSLEKVSVNNANDVWGVNSNGDVWHWNGSWTNLSGNLGKARDIAVGSDGDVHAVRADGTIAQYANGTWTTVYGSLMQISEANASNVWGVNSIGDIWKLNGSTWSYQTGRLDQRHTISAGGDGTVWAVRPDGTILAASGSSWTSVPGALTQASVVSANNAWGVDANNNLYRWTGSWTEDTSKPAPLKYVAGAPDGSLWATRLSDGAVLRKYNGVWNVLGGEITQLVGISQNDAWGVNRNGDIWETNATGNWVLRNSNLPSGSAVSIAAGGDGSIWITTSDLSLYQWNGSSWVKSAASGTISKVTAVSGSNLWGTDRIGRIFQWNGSTWVDHTNGS